MLTRILLFAAPLTALALPSAALAANDYLAVKTLGGMPSSCTLELTYKDGDTGSIESCTVTGDDSSSDREYECSVPDSSVNHISANGSYMEVSVTPDSLWECFADGGVTIGQLHGDGNTNNFRTKQIDTSRDSLTGWSDECGQDYFANKKNDGTHGRFHLAGASGNRDHDRVLTLVKNDPRPSSNIATLRNCDRTEVNFCDIFDDDSVALRSYHGTYLRGQARSKGYDIDMRVGLESNARWDVECNGDSVAFISVEEDRYLRGTQNSTVISWETAGYWQRWEPRYNNSDNTWSFLSHHDEWLRAEIGGGGSQVDTTPNKGNWERFDVFAY